MHQVTVPAIPTAISRLANRYSTTGPRTQTLVGMLPPPVQIIVKAGGAGGVQTVCLVSYHVTNKVGGTATVRGNAVYVAPRVLRGVWYRHSAAKVRVGNVQIRYCSTVGKCSNNVHECRYLAAVVNQNNVHRR